MACIGIRYILNRALCGKVGLFVLLAIFVSENAQFSALFQKKLYPLMIMPTRSYLAYTIGNLTNNTDIDWLLVLVSIATAIDLYVVKVGLFVLLAIFVSENA